MKIVLLPHEGIEKNRWDAAIGQSPHGLIYAFSWFLDAAAPGWSALVSDDYKFILPLPVRTKWKQTYVYPPFFIQQLGIFSADAIIPPDITAAFLYEVSRHFPYAEMYLHEKCKIQAEKNFMTEKRINHLLMLDQKHEQLQAAYSSQLKRNLKKAMAAGAEVRPLNEASSIIRFFRKSESGKKANYKPDDYLRLERLIMEGAARGMAEITGVFDSKGGFHGGAVFFKSHKRITFLFSGVSEYARAHSFLALLLDEKIKQHSASSFIFDFEGSMDKGLARFYKSFGSLETEYTFVKLNRLPKVIRWLK